MFVEVLPRANRFDEREPPRHQDDRDDRIPTSRGNILEPGGRPRISGGRWRLGNSRPGRCCCTGRRIHIPTTYMTRFVNSNRRLTDGAARSGVEAIVSGANAFVPSVGRTVALRAGGVPAEGAELLSLGTTPVSWRGRSSGLEAGARMSNGTPVGRARPLLGKVDARLTRAARRLMRAVSANQPLDCISCFSTARCRAFV